MISHTVGKQEGNIKEPLGTHYIWKTSTQLQFLSIVSFAYQAIKNIILSSLPMTVIDIRLDVEGKAGLDCFMECVVYEAS